LLLHTFICLLIFFFCSSFSSAASFNFLLLISHPISFHVPSLTCPLPTWSLICSLNLQTLLQARN
jgi:hypothetical protein